MSYAISLIGGKTPQLQELTVIPSQEYQELLPSDGYDGFSYVGVDSEKYNLRELLPASTNATVTEKTLTIDLFSPVKDIEGIHAIYISTMQGYSPSINEIFSLFYVPNGPHYAIFGKTSTSYQQAVNINFVPSSIPISIALSDVSDLPSGKSLVLTIDNTLPFIFVPSHQYAVWVYGDLETHGA